jgi:RNA polymerase sigma factor (sigma-70 family)
LSRSTAEIMCRDLPPVQSWTPKQEKAIARRGVRAALAIRDGKKPKAKDLDAYHAMIEQSSRFAFKIAKKYATSGLDVPEIASCAVHRLCKGLHRFDPTKSRWSTFSYWLCRGGASEAARNLTDQAAAENGQLDATAPDLAVDPADPDDVMDGVDLADTIQQILEGLDERDRTVLTRYYSLDGREWTCEAIGKDLGLTRQRVNQVLHRAVLRAREVAERKGVVR